MFKCKIVSFQALVHTLSFCSPTPQKAASERPPHPSWRHRPRHIWRPIHQQADPLFTPARIYLILSTLSYFFFRSGTSDCLPPFSQVEPGRWVPGSCKCLGSCAELLQPPASQDQHEGWLCLLWGWSFKVQGTADLNNDGKYLIIQPPLAFCRPTWPDLCLSHLRPGFRKIMRKEINQKNIIWVLSVYRYFYKYMFSRTCFLT